MVSFYNPYTRQRVTANWISLSEDVSSLNNPTWSQSSNPVRKRRKKVYGQTSKASFQPYRKKLFQLIIFQVTLKFLLCGCRWVFFGDKYILETEMLWKQECLESTFLVCPVSAQQEGYGLESEHLSSEIHFLCELKMDCDAIYKDFSHSDQDVPL